MYVIAAAFGSTPVHAQESARVLLVRSLPRDISPFADMARSFREQIEAQTRDRVELLEISLDPDQPEAEVSEAALIDYVNARYAGENVNLAVAIGAPATYFLARNRDGALLGTPMLILGADQRRLGDGLLESNDIAVATTVDFAALIENILQLRPQTRDVFVVIGNSAIEQFWQAEMEKETETFRDRLNLTWSSQMPVAEVLSVAAKLPEESAIFYYMVSVDVDGATYNNDRVLDALREVASVPIFGFGDYQLGRGVVGGPLFPARAVGLRGAEIAQRMLNGELAEQATPNAIPLDKPVYDWRELQRWSIDESLLPADGIVQYEDPGVISSYWWQFLAALIALSLQSLLIFALLYERRRRRKAEAEAQAQLLQLKRLNRQTVAGELSASLSHELRQPLMAIMLNADDALLRLDQDTPDLEEIAESLKAVIHDSHRANDIIDSVRSMFARETGERTTENLTGIVRSVIKLMRSELQRHEIVVHTVLRDALPHVSVDRVQIQQVVMNVVFNSIDAMSAQDGNSRELRIETAAGADGKIVLAISDSGPGVDAKTLGTIFAPFVTTKSGGTGLGLTICQSIIDAHGGTLAAAAVQPHGLEIRVTLPGAATPKHSLPS